MARTKKITEGVEHARALDAAMDFYREEYPDEWQEEQNVPFAGHLDTVIARLNNK